MRRDADVQMEAPTRIPAHLAAILAVVDDAVVAVDTHWRTTYLNRAAEDRYGVTLDNVEGRPISEVFTHRWLNDQNHHAFVKALAMKGFWRGETVQITRDGREIAMDMTVTVLHDENGSRIGIVATSHDITHHKNAEKRMREALAAKDRFLAVLSHELRTPLNPVMISVSELLRESDLPSHVREDLSMISRNIELETRLIDDLLDLNRLNSGRLCLQNTVVDLAEVVTQASRSVHAEARSKGLELIVNTQGPTMVSGERARLHQVIWNIVKNAVRFTSHGQVRVHCCRDRDSAVVSVDDDGIGIDPETLDRLFTAFAQCEPKSPRMFGGIGLGLSIAKALVELHGGTIMATSRGKNHGSTFTVRLPICSDAVSDDGKRHNGSRAKLLVVEDHEDSARMIARLLRRWGHDVCIAGDLATAMRMVRAEHFDLLVSDIGLPDGTGLELMRQVSRDGIRGIAISGHGTDDDRRMSHNAGFIAHLVKPVHPNELQQTIADILAAV